MATSYRIAREEIADPPGCNRLVTEGQIGNPAIHRRESKPRAIGPAFST
jgi:hypothetical protein